MKALVTFVWCLCVANTLGQNLMNRLQYYETLHHSELQHGVVRRSVRGPDGTSDEKTVKFSTLGKDFNLKLMPRRGLFSGDLNVVALDRNRHSRPVAIDKKSFYQGHAIGEQGKTKVFAHIKDGELMAKIILEEDTYIIEPSWRHLPESDEYTMLTYRASDLMKNYTDELEREGPSSYCGFVHPDHDDAAYVEKHTNQVFDRLPVSDGTAKYKREANEANNHRRKKRATTPDKTTCPVTLVADYLFFEQVGGGDVVNTINYLVEEMSVVDDIYRNQNFDDMYIGLGFEIKNIIIHEQADTYDASDITYNMDVSGSWGTQDLLTAFSKENWGDVCLAHLWTAISFSDGVLGLGWIASSSTSAAGGICSGNTGGYYYNTAWSSALNKYGERILTQEAEIVTAHEFGHNWGSQHDPSTTECAPGSSSSGDYIMYTYSVSGYENNNWDFSPCSQRSMCEVLNSKMDNCFTEASASYCGNFQVEAGYEECDSGPTGLTDTDPCCDSNCMLRSSADCSDANSVCCLSCTYAGNSVLCLSGSNDTCEADTYCDGASADCPNSNDRPDGETCIDDGQCEGGECLAFCEWNNLTSCICSADIHVCKFCCKASADDNCTAFGWPDSTPIDLPDGKSCPSGLCFAGECETAIQMSDTRLWDVINFLDTDALIEFIKKNIVLTIVILSLLLYIPICIIISCVDYHQDKKEKETLEWHNGENEKLYMDEDAQRIRRTYTRRSDSANANNNSSMDARYRQASAASSSRVHLSHNTISPM